MVNGIERQKVGEPEGVVGGAGTPKVSVIIPTFNRGWALRESVDSVLEQEYDSFELLVVDDGSTDDTGEILAQYGTKLTVVRQENRGVSAARNAGIAASSGALIAFLDSDDRWLPKKLSEQVLFFDERPDALICQTEEIWIRNGVRVNPKKHHKKPSGEIFEASLSLCLVSPSAVMMRRSLFSEVGLFDEKLPACEDYDLWLRIGCRHPIHLIDIPLILKTGGHEDQLSRAPRLDRYRILSLEKLLSDGGLTEWQAAAAVKKLIEKCAIYAMGCRKWGRQEEADHFEEKGKRWSSISSAGSPPPVS